MAAPSEMCYAVDSLQPDTIKYKHETSAMFSGNDVGTTSERGESFICPQQVFTNITANDDDGRWE